MFEWTSGALTDPEDEGAAALLKFCVPFNVVLFSAASQPSSSAWPHSSEWRLGVALCGEKLEGGAAPKQQCGLYILRISGVREVGSPTIVT